jgi:putative acetyltransferase
VSAPNVDVRDEALADWDAVRDLHVLAFEQPHEGRIVDALRAHKAAILSLVATVDGTVVGHILFSPVTVGSLVGAGLGPMAVAPSWQRRGIGSRLVESGLARLREEGCPFVVVLGHPGFYPRFGFTPAATHGLTCEWDVPAEVFMVAVLRPDVTGDLAGRVVYRREFSE